MKKNQTPHSWYFVERNHRRPVVFPKMASNGKHFLVVITFAFQVTSQQDTYVNSCRADLNDIVSSWENYWRSLTGIIHNHTDDYIWVSYMSGLEIPALAISSLRLRRSLLTKWLQRHTDITPWVHMKWCFIEIMLNYHIFFQQNYVELNVCCVHSCSWYHGSDV